MKITQGVRDHAAQNGSSPLPTRRLDGIFCQRLTALPIHVNFLARIPQTAPDSHVAPNLVR